MQSQNNRDELMLLVCKMQALVRGTLIRRSLMKLRAEFEEITEEIEGGGGGRVSIDWPASTPCRPTFKSPNKECDVLQRLAKKGWRKPELSQHSEESVSTATDPASAQYSSDFQSRSSSSSEASVRTSSLSVSLQSSSGSQADHHNEQRHLEDAVMNSEGSTDIQSPVTSTKETTDVVVIEHTKDKRESHEENSDDPKSMPSPNSDIEHDLGSERKSSVVSESREEIMHAEVFEARAASRRDVEDDEGCDPVTGGRHSNKMVEHRQSLNETDFTVVSSIEASSLSLSSSDDESVSTNAVNKTIPNTNIPKKLHQGQAELGRLHQPLNSHKDLSVSDGHNGTSAAAKDGRTVRKDQNKFDRNGKQEHIRLSSPVGQGESKQSFLPSSKANSSDVVPTFSQASNNERQDLQHLQTDREIPTEESMRRSLGAEGVEREQNRQDSLQEGYPQNDTSLAADMTSMWSTDLSISHLEQAPVRDEVQLRVMRKNTAMELLWIQQAIESRKNYLRLKSKMGCSENTDQ